MATGEKKYFITYWKEKSIVNPGDKETYYKVKSVTQSNGTVSGIALSKQQYERWMAGMTPYHYINDTHYRIEDAYVDTDQKNADELVALDLRKERDVYSLWNQYLNFDSVGNSVQASYFKAEAQAKALFLTIDGQKAFIVTQLIYLANKIAVLTDLGEDVTDLQNEYDALELDYQNIVTT